jgi:AraC-like DNA-binding protein
MKMESLAYASVDQLKLDKLRLEPSSVKAMHKYEMEPAPVERFVYITRGTVRFFLAEDTLQAGAQDMIYLPRDTAYHSLWQTTADFMVVDLLLQDGEGQDIRFGDNPCILFHDTHRVYDGLLAELANIADANGPFDWLERLSLCFKLLCHMARDTNRYESDAALSKIQKAITYLENNYCADFSVDVLADICNLSVSVFRRIFQECKGMSAVEYRNRLRIQKASELLRTGRYTVSEVAEQTGINDVKYFGKLFKRYIGMTPSALRKGGI